jgi:uncharacterized protein YacL
MSMQGDVRPLPELIGGLASDISGLFRKEIELAKAEASEKTSQVMGGLELLIAGAVLAMGALGVILAAIVSALAALFVGQGMAPTMANSIAAIIIGIIVAIVAWVLIARGRASLAASNLKMDRTASSLGRDAAAVKERL